MMGVFKFSHGIHLGKQSNFSKKLLFLYQKLPIEFRDTLEETKNAQKTAVKLKNANIRRHEMLVTQNHKRKSL